MGFPSSSRTGMGVLRVRFFFAETSRSRSAAPRISASLPDASSRASSGTSSGLRASSSSSRFTVFAGMRPSPLASRSAIPFPASSSGSRSLRVTRSFAALASGWPKASLAPFATEIVYSVPGTSSP